MIFKFHAILKSQIIFIDESLLKLITGNNNESQFYHVFLEKRCVSYFVPERPKTKQALAKVAIY